VTSIRTLQLPIDWTSLGWPATPALGTVTLATGDPRWAWHPSSPAFPIPVMEEFSGTSVDGFSVDHVVLLVPSLSAAIDTLGRVGTSPRLRMRLSGDRPAAFFRVGPVLEVIEAPVRQPSLYGVALAMTGSLEGLSLGWKALGIEVGDVRPAMQQGRRIMTVHGLDAGLAVMSEDGAVARG
jgi:hypothetical protein